MFTIGVTGGIGAGKTTASTFFEEKGAFIFNADKESKSYLKHTVSIQHKLVKAFGNQVTSQSKLSLKKLAEVAFSSAMDQAILNGILWPEIHILIEKSKKEAKREEVTLFVVDAALIIEGGFNKLLNKTLLIVADRNKRISRAIKRRNIPLDQIQKRMMLQMNDDKKIKIADDVIENNGTEEEFLEKLEQYYNSIK